MRRRGTPGGVACTLIYALNCPRMPIVCKFTYEIAQGSAVVPFSAENAPAGNSRRHLRHVRWHFSLPPCTLAPYSCLGASWAAPSHSKPPYQDFALSDNCFTALNLALKCALKFVLKNNVVLHRFGPQNFVAMFVAKFVALFLALIFWNDLTGFGFVPDV